MTSDNKDVNNPDMKSSNPKHPFYPGETSDGREKGNWKTRYSDKQAKREITKEALYLSFILIVCSVFFILISCNVFQKSLGFSESQSLMLNQYLGIFLAGAIGGNLYDLKWLIHSVGHGDWNEDRKLWRYLTPLTSGVLSVFILQIITSGLFGLFSTSLFENSPIVFSIAFLAGYFSDQMVSRVQDVFESIFGRTLLDKTKKEKADDTK